MSDIGPMVLWYIGACKNVSNSSRSASNIFAPPVVTSKSILDEILEGWMNIKSQKNTLDKNNVTNFL